MAEFVTFVTVHPWFSFYMLGCCIAFIAGIILAVYEDNQHKDIRDFPAMIAPFALCSWVSVYVVIEHIFIRKS